LPGFPVLAPRGKGCRVTEQQERVERFSEELREGPPPSDRSIKEIIDALRPQVQELVNKQIELARTELVPVGRQAGIAAGLLAVGAVFLLLFLVFFFLTGMFIMWYLGFPLWAAAGIDTVILLVIGGGLAAAGAGRLRTLDPKPRRTIAALQQNIEWVKGQLRS
jgi:Putative Actinobacterial Holin-X, holin superfamily III